MGWVNFTAETGSIFGRNQHREEYRYALDRALHSRGASFPIIALFGSTVDDSLIPAGIRVRLHFSITDPDWKERIKAAAIGRPINVTLSRIEPYHLQLHHVRDRNVIEVRPRAGTWSPFIARVPIEYKDSMTGMLHGPANYVPNGGALWNHIECQSDDGRWWTNGANNEATPSYYLFFDKVPTKIAFGKRDTELFVETFANAGSADAIG